MRQLVFDLLKIAVCIGSAALAQETFTVPHDAQGGDDTPSVLSALPGVLNHTFDRILFERGTTYNLLTPVNFGSLANVEIAVEGNISLPKSMTDVQNIVGSSSFPGAWFVLRGTNVTFRGTADPEWGWIDAHGEQWWGDAVQVNRPHGFKFSVNSLILRDIKLWKPIAWCFSLGGSNIMAINNVIDASASSSAFPFNTDGFDVSGANVFLQGNIVNNGDDCITINQGATNVHATGNICQGGHGLSVGSLGSNGQVANVSNILFENSVMVDSLYGARFKSWAGGKGSAQNITWRNIVFSNVTFPIFATQNYWDQNLGPKPPVTENSTNTELVNFKWENFVGTINDLPHVEGSCVSDPCWYAVPNATGREVIILDVSRGTTEMLFAENIRARTESGAPVAVMCDADAIAQDIGFVCQNGEYIPTS